MNNLQQLSGLALMACIPIPPADLLADVFVWMADDTEEVDDSPLPFVPPTAAVLPPVMTFLSGGQWSPGNAGA